MNVERLTELAVWLEAGATARNGVAGFDMSDFYESRQCGIVCCIAGAAIQWHYPGGLRKVEEDFGGFECAAMELLELSYEQANDLFYPRAGATAAGDSAHAARVIRHLIATGTVDWNATREAV